jgi:polyisoprenoid-binding protein YceI
MQTRYLLHFLLYLVMAVTLPWTSMAAEKYRVDPTHSSLVFKVKHLDIAYVHGRFNSFSGMVIIDDKIIENSSVEITAMSKAVDTSSGQRDKLLRSADFFDVKQFPEVTFKSSGFKKTGPNTFEVSGDLTLLGVTQPLTATVYETGKGKDPFGGIRRGFETTFPIMRTDFGMKKMPSVIAAEVSVTLSVECVLQYE